MFSNHSAYIEDIQQIASLPLPWEEMRGSSVLISGATGMIGTVLVDVLMERNQCFQNQIQLCLLGRSAKRADERFHAYVDRPEFRFVACDVTKEIPVQDPFKYIFHCASNTHPASYASDPVGTILTNIIGTRNMLDIAVRSPAKRMLFLSSVEIYGENTREKERFSENDCGYIDCNTLRAGYPEGKRTGEALCQAYMEQYGIDVVIPRLCRVFGPTMLKSDSKALAQFIKNALRGEDIVLKSEGNQYYSYCYVSDVVSALLYTLFYGERGNAYNIADKESDIHLKDLAGLLAASAGRRVVFEIPDSFEAKGYSKAQTALLDAERLRILGWHTGAGLKERLQETLDILRAE